MLGGKPLLVVDGGAPKTVAVGESWKGVKVVSAAGDQAVLEVNGSARPFAWANRRAASAAARRRQGGTRIVLTASSAATSPARAASTAGRCSSWSTREPRSSAWAPRKPSAWASTTSPASRSAWPPPTAP
jgi:hypothetical protein